MIIIFRHQTKTTLYGERNCLPNCNGEKNLATWKANKEKKNCSIKVDAGTVHMSRKAARLLQ